MRVHLVWLAVVLIAVIGAGTAGVFAANGLDADHLAGRTTSGAQGAGGAPGVGVCPAPLSAANQQALGRQLTNKIISAPPGQLDYGTQVQPLNEFVRFAYGGQPMTAQWLSLICFRLAAERTWTDVAAGRSGWIWLIKFGSSAGAAEYVTGQLRGYLTVKHAEFSVSGVSGGVGVETLSAYRGGGKATWLLGYRGDLAINVTLVYPANASPQRSAAIRLLQEQVGRL